MDSKSPRDNFIDYFSKKLTDEQLDYLNQINKVEFEKVELYRDFVLSLFHLINDTYLGDDVITNEEEIEGHFNWCWKQNIKNFKEENTHFKDKGEHHLYFMNYFKMFFYGKDKNEINTAKILFFWNKVLSITNGKTKSDYDIFIETYKIQDKYFLNLT